MRTFQSGLGAICGLSLLFLAARLAFPGRALPGCAVEASILRRLSQWLRFLGLTSRLYPNLPVFIQWLGLGLMKKFVNKENKTSR
jgi:hypothetical protein